MADAVPDAEPLELLLPLSAVPISGALLFALSPMLGLEPSVVWLESVTDTINSSRGACCLWRNSLMLNWTYDCEVVYVMYPYMTFEDGTEVIHSDLITDGDTEKVIVHFERPTAEGFDSARCELPSYNWTMWEGHFTDEEKRGFETFLSNNAHLLYRYAANGGAKVA